MNRTKHSKARLIAFYLPQYHPIPENDKWWGKGFTEWTVVAKAKPLFRGHYQPRIPADLGFYDLRLPETREAQAQLAKDHGIEGFCYWHYWLGNGKRLLERPFEEVLTSREPNYPFCLAWANHDWKGVFFGAEGRPLAKQTYPGEDDYRRHFDYLLTAFFDSRYITLNRKPILVIYKPLDIPECRKYMDLWRELALNAGLEGLYLIANGSDIKAGQWQELGFDGAVYTRNAAICNSDKGLLRLMIRLVRRLRLYSYGDATCFFLKENYGPNEFPSIIPNWDSSPRLGKNALIFKDWSPVLFRRHVRQALEKVAERAFEERLVFIKSWNEWAEGNYIEPDLENGRQYLEIIKQENSVSSIHG